MLFEGQQEIIIIHWRCRITIVFFTGTYEIVRVVMSAIAQNP